MFDSPNSLKNILGCIVPYDALVDHSLAGSKIFPWTPDISQIVQNNAVCSTIDENVICKEGPDLVCGHSGHLRQLTCPGAAPGVESSGNLSNIKAPWLS